MSESRPSRDQRRGDGLTPDGWDWLFRFLDPDRTMAEHKLAEIRLRLVRIFAWRGSTDPEDVAQDTIVRVGKLVCDNDGALAKSFVGDPTPYFLKVGRNVLHESLRRRPFEEKSEAQSDLERLPMPEPDASQEKEIMDECLQHCMQKLTTRNRRLILDYYRGEGRQKIEGRRQLAKKLGIGLNALRIRASRLRSNLEECVLECMKLNTTVWAR